MILKVQSKNMGIFLRKLFCLFICFILSVPVLAAKELVGPPSETDWEGVFIQSNKDISQWFDGFTEGIDLFLVGKRVSKQKNKSSFRIDNTTTVTEEENFKNISSIAIRPRLQNLEQFMQLKFESYDEKEDGRGVENRYLRKTQRKKNYGATVGFFQKLGKVRTTFQPRITLQDPLKVAHSLAFDSVAEIKKFKMNPRFELFADPDKGTGTFQAVNFNYEFNPVYSITLINEAEYQEKVHLMSVTNGFAVGQEYSEKTGFTYSWIFNSTNREKYHLEGHSVSVTWHQNIYRNILDTQLTPHIDFLKAKKFKGITGVVFNISLNF
ncbi:hypothetical protein CIK05_01560 [Bdellovibrio sp. qaytius]|nr:hypothetical protein CIK05_01560 [Bdellovibrio sp. qaytius]